MASDRNNFAICLSLICVLFVMSCSTSKSQNKPESLLSDYDINANIKIAEIDNLGRIYVVTDKNIIVNYNPSFKEMYRHANTKSGAISSIDVSNPLKITVFYDNFNKIKIFDNTLTQITEMNLSEKFSDITACASSNDGTYWVYDPTQFKLLKINENAEVLLETSNLNDFGMQDISITDIREKSNFVLLTDRTKGFYVFDNLGQYAFHVPAIDILSFQFDGKNIIYYTKEGLKFYSLTFKETHEITLPNDVKIDGCKFVIYHDQDFYV
ncbi:MAG TPA: hypothetical protein PKD16_18245, partial [Saprospiraceae bacterium]|nr:hypothetical protein [Saprospiraceae bacterium]HMT72116.1 hypothetical protein [Saprospiraceae bacterium]